MLVPAPAQARTPSHLAQPGAQRAGARPRQRGVGGLLVLCRCRRAPRLLQVHRALARPHLQRGHHRLQRRLPLVPDQARHRSAQRAVDCIGWIARFAGPHLQRGRHRLQRRLPLVPDQARHRSAQRAVDCIGWIARFAGPHLQRGRHRLQRRLPLVPDQARHRSEQCQSGFFRYVGTSPAAPPPSAAAAACSAACP